jgi:phosphatidylserine/phosphatidylglycerophosphate/cardiolipin synthase-like enzyme
MPPMINLAVIKYVAKGLYYLSKKRVGGSLTSNLAWLIVFIVGGFSSGYYGTPVLKYAWKHKDQIAAVVHWLKDRGGWGGQDDTPQSGSVAVYFTMPGDNAMAAGNPAEKLAGYIDQATTTMEVCCFELDNKVIVAALERAVKRGVQVRIVTETDYLDESGITAMKQLNVPILDDKRNGSLMHNKFIVFDRQRVWTGSMNFTENCAYKNNNHGVFIDNKELAENYYTKFRWMFEQHKFGGAPSKSDKIPHPLITLADGTRIENYFATHDEPAQQVMRTLSQAKKSIHFLAFSFTHDGIGQLMLDKARTGVDVQGVFEKSQSSNSHTEYGRMLQAGLQVYQDGNSRNMHHKVIVIDGEVVICGSFNFSKSADESNDENLLIIHSPSVAKRFEQEFQKVLGQAKPVPPPLQ